MTRLLKPSDIPASLWDAPKEVLSLPQSLVDAYLLTVENRELRELARSRNRDDPPVGGLTREQADQHFAQAFDGSAARALLALLDPYNHLAKVSDTIVTVLAGNNVCVIDAPCGAGATIFAILTAVADLRAEGVLPRLPLDVVLIGADLSAPARSYAEEILLLLRSFLADQGIFVTSEYHSWDATDKMSTTALVTRTIKLSENGVKRFVLVSNFTAFLESFSNRKKATAQLEELFRYSSGLGCVSLWIEPNMNRATKQGGTFAWLIASIKSNWCKFMSLIGLSNEATTHFVSSARFREPLEPTVQHRVNIAVIPISLEHNV